MPSKKCTKCGLVGDIDECFGYFKATRMSGGPHKVLRPQSRCYWCHGRKTPRTYPPDREAVRRKYIGAFPRDKNNTKRSLNFMLAKLIKKGAIVDVAR